MPDSLDIAGVYRQVGSDIVHADGSIESAGDPRNSQLVYTADGYMSIVSTPPDRVRPSSPGLIGLEDVPIEELPGVVKDMVVYAGRYVVRDGVVEHHVDMALNPNLIGGTVVRNVHLDGADLTLSAGPDKNGNSRHIRWRRVPASTL